MNLKTISREERSLAAWPPLGLLLPYERHSRGVTFTHIPYSPPHSFPFPSLFFFIIKEVPFVRLVSGVWEEGW